MVNWELTDGTEILGGPRSIATGRNESYDDRKNKMDVESAIESSEELEYMNRNLVALPRNVRDPVVAPRDELKRIIGDPEEFLGWCSASPALLITEDHSLNDTNDQSIRDGHFRTEKSITK